MAGGWEQAVYRAARDVAPCLSIDAGQSGLAVCVDRRGRARLGSAPLLQHAPHRSPVAASRMRFGRSMERTSCMFRANRLRLVLGIGALLLCAPTLRADSIPWGYTTFA